LKETETMTPLYRGMDRASLDLAYNNVAAEPRYPERMSDFKERSDVLYLSTNARRNIPYGDRLRQRFDWLASGNDNAQTFVFIHGGYWQTYTKEDLAFIASGPLARGFNVILAEYTLAPEASMTEIVGEIGALLDHLQVEPGEAGFGGRAVCLCGHSAGGQLAALQRTHPAITLTLAISALSDLEPIALSWLNEKLKLTLEEISTLSPLYRIESGAPIILSVGENELPELVRQTQSYEAALKYHGEAVTVVSLPGKTHFSVLDDLADPFGMLMNAVADAMADFK
jgi:arylformamidase